MTIGGTFNSNKTVKFGSPIEFTFADNPDWRANITSITFTLPNWPDVEKIHDAQMSIGEISFPHQFWAYNASGFWTWTIKATGYPDTVVTVTVQK